MPTPDRDTTARFYRCALAGLGVLVQHQQTRDPFSDDANALWSAARGHLTAADRVDLVLADAAVAWPVAFSTRDVFALEGLAEDAAFPRDWPGIDPNVAPGATQRTVLPGVGNAVEQASAAVAVAWGPRPVPDAAARAALADAPRQRRFVIAGGAALAAAVAAASEGGLDLAAQVVLVSERPDERQWLGLAAAAHGARESPLVLRHASAAMPETAEALRDATVLVSADADDKARRAAELVQARR